MNERWIRERLAATLRSLDQRPQGIESRPLRSLRAPLLLAAVGAVACDQSGSASRPDPSAQPTVAPSVDVYGVPAPQPSRTLFLQGDVAVSASGQCSGCSGSMELSADVQGDRIRVSAQPRCEGPCAAIMPLSARTVLKDLAPKTYTILGPTFVRIEPVVPDGGQKK